MIEPNPGVSLLVGNSPVQFYSCSVPCSCSVMIDKIFGQSNPFPTGTGTEIPRTTNLLILLFCSTKKKYLFYYLFIYLLLSFFFFNLRFILIILIICYKITIAFTELFSIHTYNFIKFAQCIFVYVIPYAK